MGGSTTTITDMDADSLAECGRYLDLQDLANMAMSSKSLKTLAYSDSIWQRWFSEHFPQKMLSTSSQASGVRESYLARRTALRQFKFVDPLAAKFQTFAKPFDQLLLDKNSDIIFSQGSMILMIKIGSIFSGRDFLVTLDGHNARITCMRLFPLRETSLFRSETQQEENVLITSSCDHSIRLWWKGSCQRCFRGHSGCVSSLSDKLLGDSSSRVFASGGEDGTVRLWSLSSGGKRGQKALKATYYGHSKPVKLMSVAGHKTSLLVTISQDSKVRVWDTTASSTARSSCCVGMTSVLGAPVGMKCDESLLYVAAGSSVSMIDLRTMQRVSTAASQREVYSFDILPSKSLVCTGGDDKAMLWDIRKSQGTLKPEPVIVLDGHIGPVTQLQMDPYKIVTGGPLDDNVNVWEVDTGTLTNTLVCRSDEDPNSNPGCSAMAANGCRIVTATCGNDDGLVWYRDFTDATCPVSYSHEDKPSPSSKFWGPQSYSDSENSDD